MVSWRIFLLLGLLLFVGFITRAFAVEPMDRTTVGITRAEAVALLVSSQEASKARASWFRDHLPPIGLFSDVSAKDWEAPYLEAAFEEGWVRGDAVKDRGMKMTFRPHDFLKAEEAVVLLRRWKERGSDVPPVLILPGAEKTLWFSQALQALLSDGTDIPQNLTIGLPIGRSVFYAMLRSSGVPSPESVAFLPPPVPPAPPPTLIAAAQPVPAQVRSVPAATAIPGRISLQSIRPTTVSPSRATAPRALTPTTTTQPTQSRPTVFTINMPTLGISNLRVTHPKDPFTHNGLLAPLQQGVGHLFSYPGTNGKILVYGHSSGYPWDVSKFTKIFRQINKLAIGDQVTIDYSGTVYTYQVTSKETVPAKNMDAYKNTGTEELVLYTCWPPDSISQRYLVHAKPVSKVAAK